MLWKKHNKIDIYGFLCVHAGCGGFVVVYFGFCFFCEWNSRKFPSKTTSTPLAAAEKINKNIKKR